MKKKAGSKNWVKYGQSLDEKSLEKFYELFLDTLKKIYNYIKLKKIICNY